MVQLITQYSNKRPDNTVSNLYPLRNVQINLQMQYTKTKSSRHANRTNYQQTQTGSDGLLNMCRSCPQITDHFYLNGSKRTNQRAEESRLALKTR